MDEVSAKFIWSFIANELIEHQKQAAEHLDAARYAMDGDLPADIDALLSSYFLSMDKKIATEVAAITARRFYLSSYQPENHLVLVAYLLSRQVIDVVEACELAQIDASNFALMSNEAKDLVRFAETIAEDQRMGVVLADADSSFDDQLQDFCRSKAISWGLQKPA